MQPSPTLREMADFLRERGGADVGHTEGTYLGHCAAVYRDMQSWGYGEEMARAGFFHSVYGTGIFDRFQLPLASRPAVRELIGERAEWLAFLNCSIDYDAFDAELERGTPPFGWTGRLTGEKLQATPAEFDDLVAIHLVDRLEQVPRSKQFAWRREAFRRMAERLGPAAVERYEQVYGIGAASR